MYYFTETKPKEWIAIEALCVYDEKYPGRTFYDVLEILRSDLVGFMNGQKSLEKHVKSMLEQIKKLKNLKCLELSIPRNYDENLNIIDNETEQEAIHQDSCSKNPTTVNNFEINKFSGNFINGSSSASVNYKEKNNKRPSDSKVSEHQPKPKASVVITEGTKKYQLVSPNFQSDDQHMPKLRKCHVEVLNDLVNFGTSFALSNSIISDIYHAHEQDQANYTSLRKHNVFDHAIALLRHNDVESFVQNIWASKIEGLTDKEATLLNIIQFTLTSFHLTLRNQPMLVQNHERTHFIESIIPSLLAVSKITGFMEFKWCETQFTSGKYLDYRKSDYTTNSLKYNDALGYFKLFNNMEVIIVEASSGKIQESTVHTIEDCLKLLECGISSLRKEAILNKNSSIATFQKLKVFGLQSIQNQVTLSELYMNNATSWNFVEKRTATLPSSWDNRIMLIKYLELIATIFDDICDTHHLLQRLTEENLGLTSTDSRSLKSMFEEQANIRTSSL